MRQEAPRKKTVRGTGAALHHWHMGTEEEGTLPGPCCTAAHLALSHSPNGHAHTPLHTNRKIKTSTKQKSRRKNNLEPSMPHRRAECAAPPGLEESCLHERQTLSTLPRGNKNATISKATGAHFLLHTMPAWCVCVCVCFITITKKMDRKQERVSQ